MNSLEYEWSLIKDTWANRIINKDLEYFEYLNGLISSKALYTTSINKIIIEPPWNLYSGSEGRGRICWLNEQKKILYLHKCPFYVTREPVDELFNSNDSNNLKTHSLSLIPTTHLLSKIFDLIINMVKKKNSQAEIIETKYHTDR